MPVEERHEGIYHQTEGLLDADKWSHSTGTGIPRSSPKRTVLSTLPLDWDIPYSTTTGSESVAPQSKRHPLQAAPDLCPVLLTAPFCSVSGYAAQLSTQSAILLELASKVREGTIGKAFKPAAKVVYVGHSFGSSVSLAATAASPAGADAVILTG